jgi:hypothetical protein
MKKTIIISIALLVIFLFLFFSACQNGVSLTTAVETSTQQTATSASAVETTASETTAVNEPGTTGAPPVIKPDTKPEPVAKTNVLKSDYIVFAWNDLGMHCANPSYDTAVLLPPYNTIWAQVIKRGNPPQIVTENLTVEYSFENNTYSYGKGNYGQFWDNAMKLFGGALEKDKGLNLKDPSVSNGLSGNMAVESDHFEVVGVPLTPIDDSNFWSPYQVAVIVVKDSSGSTVAETKTMAPVSDEINCAKCHGADAFNDILAKHDTKNGTKLVSQKPVLCASCHGDPALGGTKPGTSYLSEAIHGFHATVNNVPACYDCHPGDKTKCSRSLAHSGQDGNCISCHGDLAQIGDSIKSGTKIPWVNEPKCITCHSGVAEVDTGDTLYRNAMGHGGVYCASCHSSPHSMVPSSQQADNYQALQYQGKEVPISSCAACHPNSKGEGANDYSEAHGGSNPEAFNGCFICHTSVNPADTSKWPHGFQWKQR